MAVSENSLIIGPVLDCRLWGKEKGLPRPYPVVCHMMDAAAVFSVLWDDLLEAERGGSPVGTGLLGGAA
jgi:CRISPR-associated endonuclease/helicase Cas3